MKNKDFLALVAVILAVAGPIIMMVGCKSPEKATAYLKKKGKLAEVCANEFPVKETVIYKKGDTVIQTVEVPGEKITITDTLNLNGEIVYRDRFISCPPTKTTTKTVHDTVFQIRENTARVEQFKQLLADQDKELKATQDESDKYQNRAARWWVWILVGSALTIGIRVALKFMV